MECAQKPTFPGANKLLSALGTGITSSSQCALKVGNFFPRPSEVGVAKFEGRNDRWRQRPGVPVSWGAVDGGGGSKLIAGT